MMATQSVLTDYLDQLDSASVGGTRLAELLPERIARRRSRRIVGEEHAVPEHAAVIAADQAALRQHFRTISLYEFPDAVVLGQGAVVTCTDHLIYDSVAQSVNQGRVPEGFLGRDGDAYVRPEISRHIAGRALVVKTTFDRNYGHFLFQGTAILALMRDYIAEHAPSIIVASGGSPQLLALQRMMVAEFAPGRTILELPDHEAWTVEQLIYVSPLHVPPLSKRPETLAFLRDYFLAKAFAGVAGVARYINRDRRLYLARRSYQNREITNLAELEMLLGRFGFEVFYAEDHAHSRQVRAFAEASIVIGVKGAALTNTLFCSPNCKIIVLSPSYWPDPFFWDIAGQLGLDYVEIFGPSASPGSFTVDIDAVQREIEAD